MGGDPHQIFHAHIPDTLNVFGKFRKFDIGDPVIADGAVPVGESFRIDTAVFVIAPAVIHDQGFESQIGGTLSGRFQPGGIHGAVFGIPGAENTVPGGSGELVSRQRETFAPVFDCLIHRHAPAVDAESEFFGRRRNGNGDGDFVTLIFLIQNGGKTGIIPDICQSDTVQTTAGAVQQKQAGKVELTAAHKVNIPVQVHFGTGQTAGMPVAGRSGDGQEKFDFQSFRLSGRLQNIFVNPGGILLQLCCAAPVVAKDFNVVLIHEMQPFLNAVKAIAGENSSAGFLSVQIDHPIDVSGTHGDKAHVAVQKTDVAHFTVRFGNVTVVAAAHLFVEGLGRFFGGLRQGVRNINEFARLADPQKFVVLTAQVIAVVQLFPLSVIACDTVDVGSVQASLLPLGEGMQFRTEHSAGETVGVDIFRIVVRKEFRHVQNACPVAVHAVTFGLIIRFVSQIPVVEGIGIHTHRYTQIFELTGTGGCPAPGTGFVQSRHQHTCQDRNDGDDYQQLNQCEVHDSLCFELIFHFYLL